MRLIGSLTEERLRAELLGSNAALRVCDDATLMAILRDQGVDLATAFLFAWIPEQGEEIFTILDGCRQALTIELSRCADTPPIVQTTSFVDFREAVSRMSRPQRLKLAVALDLMRKPLGPCSGTSG